MCASATCSAREARAAAGESGGPVPAGSAALSTAERAYPLNAAVEHREWGPGVVMRHEPDRITVLFEQVGYRTLALRALRNDGGLLVRQ